ncbi:MAG: DEAD/DEAH box helicase [Methylacidiphilaceae bacterium]|nr:DEAD/DEAH box helicase [Candidatus Methylacidiphilaceae bacterium]
MRPKSQNRTAAGGPGPEPKLSRHRPPDHLTPLEWQRRLRRQFGRDQSFGLENLGSEPFFSEFRVTNPLSRSSYRVAIRGREPGSNFCSCPDFATSELGTCKHIEFTLGLLERKRGAKAAFARGYQPPFSEIYSRNEGKRQIHFRAGTDCPPSVREAAAALFDLERDGRLREARFEEIAPFLVMVAQSGHECRARDNALDFLAGRRDAARRAAELDRLFPGGPADPRLVTLLETPLYPYQAEGALFAARAGRALLCDDMGLGKTIQAIATAEILARHFGVSKVLVICPASLKYQWQSELERFSERARQNGARVIAGGRRQREKDYAREDFCKITNYEKLQPDLDRISAWSPDLVIVDEAQRVKNWNTIAARALKRVDSPYAIVLTGTPLENKLEELISIVQFVDQHRLGPTWKLLHKHQVKDETGRVTGYTGLEEIGRTLAPILIRRRRAEVLGQLPSRTDQNLLVPMTEKQMVYHRENADLVAKIVARWRKTGFLSDKDQRRLTCALQKMRMSCDSTYLLDQESDHGVKADELAARLGNLFAEPGTKAVVFSQWTRTQEILIRRLEAAKLGYVRFHGGIPSDKRPELLERFRDDPGCRVFLSTDAGSTGLNLQQASVVVNIDLPWNPAILEQRIARVHRLGQSRPVQVISFVSKGTIEEGMLSVLAFKRSLSAGILDGESGEISLGGSRLHRFLKEVETVTGRMGEGELLTANEESGGEAPAGESKAGEEFAPNGKGVNEAPARSSGAAASRNASPDPWQALAQVGAQLTAALAAASDSTAPPHPWVERDPVSGAQHFKIPLPPPAIAKELADALSSLADRLRGGTP